MKMRKKFRITCYVHKGVLPSSHAKGNHERSVEVQLCPLKVLRIYLPKEGEWVALKHDQYQKDWDGDVLQFLCGEKVSEKKYLSNAKLRRKFNEEEEKYVLRLRLLHEV